MASRDTKKTTKGKSPEKGAKARKGAKKAPVKAAAAKATKPAEKRAKAGAKVAVKAKAAPVKAAAKGAVKTAAPKGKVAAPAKAKVDEKRNGTVKAAEAAKAKADAPAAAAAGSKVPPKGITVVQSKPVRRPRPKVKFEMPKSEPLIKPGGKWKPLIPSGPKAPAIGAIGGQDQTQLPMEERIKTKFNKRELEQYRQILLRKRAELVGDISHMEDEALRQGSGSLSHVPQHMAEQGTDTYEQGLSLDLAAVDRNLLREIDDALKRIAQGTYGICERTGNPIKSERLQEIPWARYSIEAAREMERRPYQE